MGLEAVKEEILNSAREQAHSLVAESKKEASRLLKETEAKIDAFREKSDAEAKSAMDALKRQEIASAELESRKMLLEAKKEVIAEAMLEARKKLEKLDDRKREAHIKKLLEKVRGEMESAYVYCNRKDAKHLSGMKSENTDIIGGIIAENADRTIRIDYSFDMMLDSIKENELQSISKALFG